MPLPRYGIAAICVVAVTSMAAIGRFMRKDERPVAVVQPAMTRRTHQSQLINVRFALCRRVERHHVMGLAKLGATTPLEID